MLGFRKFIGLAFTWVVLGTVTAGFAATETLFSNWALSVAPAGSEGALWVYSRGDVASGITRITVAKNNSGDYASIRVVESKQEALSDSVSAMQSGFLNDKLSERRRIATADAGDLGRVLPMFTFDDAGQFLMPAGFFSVRGMDAIYETPVTLPVAATAVESPMDYATSGFAFDKKKNILWAANGVLGLLKYDISKGIGNEPKISRLLFNRKSLKLEELDEDASIDLEKYTSIYDVTVEESTGDLWMSTAKGLWIYKADGSVVSASKALEESHVTGLWMGGSPLQIIAETSLLKDGDVKGSLWRKFAKDKDFAKVPFLNAAKNAEKRDIFDKEDYTTTGVAFIGKQAFVGVWVAGGSVSGYLRLDSSGVRGFTLDEEEETRYLHSFETGVTDRDAIITSITAFPMEGSTTGLAVATYGNGISVSADSGATWTPILNRAKLSGNLGSVRMVPSVIAAGGESLVSYKVSKDSKITIEVFSYDMKKVRKIVKSAPRAADDSRSTNAKEDVWDGLDDYGRPCTMGIYYVRVKDNHGHIGWGKVMTLGGGR